MSEHAEPWLVAGRSKTLQERIDGWRSILEPIGDQRHYPKVVDAASALSLISLLDAVSVEASKGRLTSEERAILDHLAEAWNGFAQLTREHYAESAEFADAIHRAQDLIAMRVARRTNPDVFPGSSASIEEGR